MADISTYLAAILSAVYGEEVRGSIHDAIELINDVSEVVMSTGTAVTSPTSSSEGFYDKSLYLNTNTFELWKCVGTNSWVSLGVLKGADGNGITDISKTSTSGRVDTYTITFDDGSTETFNVTNGENGADGADGIDGSTWYKGTALSGTGTSITGFPGKRTDFYLNSSTGMVYTCVKGGSALPPDAAEWDYVMTLTGGGGGSSVTVIDNLTSTSSSDALSANQGRVLKGLVDSKASDTQTFTQASARANLVSGESLSTLFGKIMKWFADLKDLAFIAKDGVSSTKFLRGDGTWQEPPAGGHTMTPSPDASVDEAAVVSAIKNAVNVVGGADDDVVSAYGVGKWSNVDRVTIWTTITQNNDTIGAWNDNWKEEVTPDRTGWIYHTYLAGILSTNDVDLNIVFDPKEEEVVTLAGWRIDDNYTYNGVTVGCIAIKLNAPVKSANGVKIGIVLDFKRTEVIPATTI